MEEPNWAKIGYPKIDYQDIHYYAAPKKKDGPRSLDEVDPELLRTYEKLGIPLRERAILAGVYGTTLLYWLRDDSEENEATLAFLDRRLASVGRIGKARRRAEALVQRFRPGATV